MVLHGLDGTGVLGAGAAGAAAEDEGAGKPSGVGAAAGPTLGVATAAAEVTDALPSAIASSAPSGSR